MASSNKPIGPPGHQLSGCSTVPGFSFLCRRSSSGGLKGCSLFEKGHGRTVCNWDGVNSLDNHIHILIHIACLAKSFNGFQERDTVSLPKTAQNIRCCNLVREKNQNTLTKTKRYVAWCGYVYLSVLTTRRQIDEKNIIIKKDFCFPEFCFPLF